MIYTWHKIEDMEASALMEHKMKEVTVQEKRIGLLKKGDVVHAFAALCPHTGAPLCEGWLDARGHIVCPLHNYHFDPANGRNTSGEGYKLKTYPVEIKENSIYIGL
jgi:3-phenylpropionate/trans-cinnamate dioxygenase ferredoxin subunit